MGALCASLRYLILDVDAHRTREDHVEGIALYGGC